MSRKLIRSASIFVLASALLVGCNSKEITTSGQKQTNEITISDLVKKTQEAGKKKAGVKTKANYTFSPKMPGFSMEVKMERQKESTNNPKSSHYVEKTWIIGQEEKTEGYTENGVTYEYDSIEKAWHKYEDDFESPLSPEAMDPLTQELLSLQSTYELMGDEAADLQHKDGSYTLSFQSSKSQAAQRAASFLVKLLGTGGPMKEPNAKDFMNIQDVKVKNWTVKNVIDEKTFEVKKTVIHVEIIGKTGKEKQEAGVKIDMVEEVVGIQEKPIVVPADIKKKAKPFDFKDPDFSLEP